MLRIQRFGGGHWCPNGEWIAGCVKTVPVRGVCWIFWVCFVVWEEKARQASVSSWISAFGFVPIPSSLQVAASCFREKCASVSCLPLALLTYHLASSFALSLGYPAEWLVVASVDLTFYWGFVVSLIVVAWVWYALCYSRRLVGCGRAPPLFYFWTWAIIWQPFEWTMD